MVYPSNRFLTRGGTGSVTETDQDDLNSRACKTYTGSRLGNDHGSINFGHIHQQAEVIADVLIQGSDGRHSICLDKNNIRQGCTQITAPGRITIESGEDLRESQDTLFIHAWNGNIDIIAKNGKIKLQGTDIELVAVGEGGSKGNITMRSSESILLDSKKVLTNASTACKIVSSGTVEMAANSCLQIYASVAKIATDASANKDSKVGTKVLQIKNTIGC